MKSTDWLADIVEWSIYGLAAVGLVTVVVWIAGILSKV